MKRPPIQADIDIDTVGRTHRRRSFALRTQSRNFAAQFCLPTVQCRRGRNKVIHAQFHTLNDRIHICVLIDIKGGRGPIQLNIVQH